LATVITASSPELPELADLLTERRQSVRKPPRSPCLVQFLVRPRHAPDWAILGDVSPEGVCLLVGAPLQMGTRLYLQLHPWFCGAPINRVARVVHVAPDSALRWRIGCTFIHGLDAVDLYGVLTDPNR
jgi:hypothetical protein